MRDSSTFAWLARYAIIQTEDPVAGRRNSPDQSEFISRRSLS